MALAFLLAVTCVMLVLVGIGIGIACIMALCAAMLAALGIVSSSALFGVLRRRFSSGLRALHYQAMALLGWPAGVGLMWLGSQLLEAGFRIREIFVIGSVSGIGGGLLVAFTIDRIAQALYRRLAKPALLGAQLS